MLEIATPLHKEVVKPISLAVDGNFITRLQPMTHHHVEMPEEFELHQVYGS